MSGRVGAYLRQNVLGLVAIFLALSAGAYAVQKAPKNSVVSKSIKNGQVKNADVSASAVTADKLGFDPATQGELDAAASATASSLSALSAAGTINDAANPVDWTKLKGVPAGFADGVDRLFGLGVTDSSGDTTPNVADVSVLSLEAAAPLTITDLENGVAGQVVTLHQLQTGASVTVNDAGQFVLNANFTSTAGDTLTVARVPAGFWVEVARSAN